MDSIITQQMKERYYGLGLWGRGTFLDHFLYHSGKRPDEVFIVDRGKAHTFSQIREGVEAIANNLVHLGFRRGNRAAIQVPNWAEFFYFHFAIERIGGIIITLTPNLRRYELEYLLNRSRCEIFIFPKSFRSFNYLDMVKEIKPRCPSLVHIVPIDEGNDSEGLSFKKLLKKPEDVLSLPEEIVPVREEDIYSLKITSGTTSMPKVFTYTENGYVNAAYNVVDTLRLTSEDVIGAIAPITQGIGQLVGFGASTIAGCRVVLIPYFNPVDVLSAIERERITVGVAVPTMLAKILSVSALHSYDLSSLRAFQVAGAVLSPIIAERFEKELDCIIVNTYGSSEGPIPFSTHLDDPAEIRYNTVGHILPGHEVKIMDPDGNVLPPGEVGEVWSRGPSTGSGFLNDPEANASSFTKDGWFRHGDLGSIDEKGIGRIVGRKKEIIIRGGQNISPKEIEDVLLSMPQIDEVAIIGIPDPLYGERICACIVLKEKAKDITLDEIRSFMRDKGLASFKFPERLEILDELPRSGGEKIQKELLINMFS